MHATTSGRVNGKIVEVSYKYGQECMYNIYRNAAKLFVVVFFSQFCLNGKHKNVEICFMVSR